MNKIFQKHECLSKPELHNYLQGSLSGTQRHRVENHLLDCPLCQDAVEGFQAINTTAVPAGDFRSFQRDLYRKRKGSGRTISLRRTIPLAVAACLIGILMVVGINEWKQDSTADPMAFNNLEMSSQTPVADYFSDSDLALAEVRGEMARVQKRLPSALQMGIESITDTNYTETLTVVTNFLNEQVDTPNEVTTYYAGLSAYQAKDQPLAEDYLQRVIEAPGNRYREPARWYFALNLMKQGRLPEARTVLVDLSQNASNSQIRKQATDLLANFQSDD